MSVDTPAGGDSDRRAAGSCSICGRSSVDPDGRFLACYATAGIAVPPIAARDGLLSLCGTCSASVAELTTAWTAIDRPPVGSAPSIADSYAVVTRDCSFCEASVDDRPVLGVESWPVGVSAEPDPEYLDHYALCETCVPIFAEFLEGLSSET